jgi:hypothetical protein
MWLVHEDATKDGKWQVAWMWMPHFLAVDGSLHKFVGEKMTEEFKGTMLEGDVHNMYPPSLTPILQRMHNRVIDLILEKYPINGLRGYLESIKDIHPDEESTDALAQKTQ